MSGILVVIGFTAAAGFGGTVRWYAAQRAVKPELAILLLNITGSFLLGLAHNASSEWHLIIGTALLGALTTFSTFVHAVVRLAREPEGVLLLSSTLISCIAMAWVGIQLAPG